MLSMNVELSGIREAQYTLSRSPKELERARKYAMQKALQVMRTEAVRDLQTRYYVKGSEVRKSIMLIGGSSSGQFISRGKRKNIASYHVTPSKPGKKRKRLFGAVRKDGLKSLGNAFLMRSKSGSKYLVMARSGSERYPIKAITGPAIPEIMKNEQTLEQITKSGGEALQKEFRRQALRLMGVMK